MISSLNGDGGGYISPIVVRFIWDFVFIFIYFDSRILFLSVEKIFF